ncbi:nuclear transport factor 2 family protein [Undibacterium cyanobacteriorum]
MHQNEEHHLSQSAYAIIKAHYAASAKADIEGMMRDVAADVRWTEMQGFPCAGTWIGPQQVIDNVFKVLAKDWINYRFELEQLIDAGDTVIGIGNYLAQHRQSGKALNARVAHVWKVEKQKIIAFEQFTDTLLVAKAMID